MQTLGGVSNTFQLREKELKESLLSARFDDKLPLTQGYKPLTVPIVFKGDLIELKQK